MRETKEFPTETVLSMATGLGCGAKFDSVHEATEFVLGHPVWTHEFASKQLWERMRSAVLLSAPQIIPFLGPIGAAKGNDAGVHAAVAAAIAVVGATVTLAKGEEVRDKNPLEMLREVMPDKPVIVVQG